MIIWSGWGFIVALLGFACLILTRVIVDAMMQDDQYFKTHGWPRLVALWLAAAVSWPIGHAMNRGGEERELLDPETGETVTVQLSGGHSLFFIPVQHWWIVFLILGVVFVFV